MQECRSGRCSTTSPTWTNCWYGAAELQASGHWGVLQPPAPGRTLAERIEDAVAQRAALFEAIGGVRRVAVRYEHSRPVLAERLRKNRAALRRHLRRALQPELASLDRPAVEGLQAAASWETWEVLRRHQGLSVGAARAAVRSTVECAFSRALTREV